MLKLTEKKIRNGCDSGVFARGLDYHKTGHVRNLTYDPNQELLEADVEGSYGHYPVEVSLASASLEAECHCPYEGWPCKHIVAVCLAYIAEKDHFKQKAKV